MRTHSMVEPYSKVERASSASPYNFPQHSDRMTEQSGSTHRNSLPRMSIASLLNPSDNEARYCNASGSSPHPIDIDAAVTQFHEYLKTSRDGQALFHTSILPDQGDRRPSSAPSLPNDSSVMSNTNISVSTDAHNRQFRPIYTDEQSHFIWFQIVDLKRDWDDALKEFRKIFPDTRRNKSGLQCRYYRVIGTEGLHQRQMTKKSDNFSSYGFWPTKKIRYDWMQEYASRLPGMYTRNVARYIAYLEKVFKTTRCCES